MRRQKLGSYGFTLAEMILTALLVSLVGLAIFHIFSQGVKLWNRAVHNRSEMDIYLGMEKITNDVRNTMRYSAKKFDGTLTEMEFYTQNASPSFLGPQQVKYTYDQFKKEVKRGSLNNKEVLDTNSRMEENIFFGNVTNFELNYYYVDGKNAHEWKNSWSDPCLPEAVRVSLDYLNEKQTKRLTKVIPIPAGGCVVV